MNFRETYHRADRYGKSSDTIVYAPYAWSGNDHNSHNRYAAVASESGFDVVTMSIAGTGKVIIDKATKRALRSADITDLAEEEAVRAQTITSDYANRVGLGDSGRGVWIAKMQTGSIQPFNRLVIRDGINLHAPEKYVQGIRRLLSSGSGRGETGDSMVPNDQQSKTDMLYSAACGIAEIRNHVSLMCGLASVEAMIDVVLGTETPILHVGLGHGIGGSLYDMQQFTTSLASERVALNNDAACIFQAEPTWGHGNLMEPDGVVKHVQQVLTLHEDR